jgi:prepilin-type processing-associated H-X9-DG protein
MSLDRIGNGDGTTHTLLLSENIDAGLAVDANGWLSNHDQATVFAAEFDNVKYAASRTWDPASQMSLDSRINSGKPQNGTNTAENNVYSPRPSSNHAGLVNVIWADGHAVSLSEDIDVRVYALALTSAGSLHGQPLIDDLAVGSE